MTKNRRQLTATKQGDKHGIQHTEETDDNLLPDATEIEKLHVLDPDILPWLKQRAEQEQNYRHSAYSKRLEFIERQNKREHNTGRLGVTLYFILVAGCIATSYFLLKEGHSVQGSILGGVSVIFALAILVTRRPKQHQEK